MHHRLRALLPVGRVGAEPVDLLQPANVPHEDVADFSDSVYIDVEGRAVSPLGHAVGVSSRESCLQIESHVRVDGVEAEEIGEQSVGIETRRHAHRARQQLVHLPVGDVGKACRARVLSRAVPARVLSAR